MLVNYVGLRPSALSADAFTNSQAGLKSAQNQVTQASTALAKHAQVDQTAAVATDASGVQVSSLTRELIHLAEGELVFKANARSMQAAATMFDSLLSIGQEQSAHQSGRAEEGR